MKNYPVDDKKVADLNNRFTYHHPQEDQPERYTAIRDKIKEVAFMIAELTPASREQSLSLTHLEEACFWANASIARHEGNESGS